MGTDADVDVVVVGARSAGSAAATAFARTGRRVVAVDAARFPSGTVSTHLLWAGGVAELQRIGALERVESIGAPRLRRGYASVPGAPPIDATYTPVDGIDFGLCVRRRFLDAALVETARSAGAEVREHTRVLDVLWEDGRAAGVVVRTGKDAPRPIRARLVVGADGRRSTVAALVGAMAPHTSNPNQRACFYTYFHDVRDEWRSTGAQWRDGHELGTTFPCDGGLVLVLLMPPLDRCARFESDRQGEFERTARSLAGLEERLRGCSRRGPIMSATNLESYFRHSSGPGWALVGDAGHFKDPVTAQGIRDAIRFGRLLGEAAADVLDEPGPLDEALAAWEAQRDRECIETYHWTNLMGRADPVGPVDIALYEHFSRPEHAHKLLDVHSRVLSPSELLPPPGVELGA